MTITAPTAAEFVARYPTFASVSADAISAVLQEAVNEISERWSEADRKPAMLAFAAHMLVQEGQGGVVIDGITMASNVATRVKAGDSEFEFQPASNRMLVRNGNANPTLALQETVYGRRFLELLRRNIPAVAIVGGGCYR